MKKLLALMLAAVLLLGMIPAAGAAFTDAGEIAKKDKAAVDFVSELGVISGFPDGTFRPKDNLTRAQAAKILCVMLEGADKLGELTNTETGFTDVPANHWAAKFVAYCAEKNIVAGVGDGKFDPDGLLSSAAFAKMLLVAYGSDPSKMTGNDWIKGVQEEMEPTFLTYQLDHVSKANIQRQNACQMAWNAIYNAAADDAASTKDLSRELPRTVPEKIKLLAVGNSFSNDCVLDYFYAMLQEVGVKEITLGNLYHSGCSLEGHTKYGLTNAGEYTYYKNTSGKWESTKQSKLEPALLDEEWEIITFQQASAYSGRPETFTPWQKMILAYVQARRPDALFGWNMTWSHGADSEKEGFKYYDRDSMKMYKAIVSAVQEKVLTEPRYQFVIPVGTAIQNARSSYLGDTMNRDGQHLHKGIGRYIAAMTWCCKLTGCNPAMIKLAPEGLTKGQIAVAKEAVANALKNPFGVTQSQITSEPK